MELNIQSIEHQEEEEKRIKTSIEYVSIVDTFDENIGCHTDMNVNTLLLKIEMLRRISMMINMNICLFIQMKCMTVEGLIGDYDSLFKMCIIMNWKVGDEKDFFSKHGSIFEHRKYQTICAINTCKRK
jgi:DNA integrity scanning protein DisA with diadenylate cyclase activity